jgi:SAM-dependent methyltransferase
MLPELYQAHHGLHLEDLPFWLELTSQCDEPVLELGCGTGRVLIPLAQAGHQMVGIDHDLAMLRYLRTSLPTHARYDLFLIAADITNFWLNLRFGLVILPCNTLSTLSQAERQACLVSIRRHLQPGGTFAVSVPNPQVLERLTAQSTPELEDEFFHTLTGNPVQVSSSWQRTRQAFNVTWNYDQLFPDGKVERVTMKASHHRVSTQGYLDEIHSAGLRVDHLYGDFDLSPYTSESPNLIILATAGSY